MSRATNIPHAMGWTRNAQLLSDPATGRSIFVDPRGRPGGRQISHFPGTPLYDLPTIGIGGWQEVLDAALSISTDVTWRGKPTLKVNATGSGYTSIRYVIPTRLLNLAKNKLSIPIFLKNGMHSTVTPIFITSSDTPPASPGGSLPANRKEFSFPPACQKRGQFNVLSVHLQATADNSPTINLIGQSGYTGVWSNGTGNQEALTQIIIAVGMNNGINDPEIEKEFYVGVPTFGQWTTPMSMLMFDGAGFDVSHTRRLLPEIEKRGLRASFSFQGQDLTDPAVREILARVIRGGHAANNEMLNHINFSLDANAPFLIPYYRQANINYTDAGSDGSHAGVAAMPNNSIRNWGAGNGLQELAAEGVYMARAGQRILTNIYDTTMPMGPVMIDGRDSAYLGKCLDSQALHGEIAIYSGHTMVDTVVDPTVQISSANMIAFLDDYKSREMKGEHVNVLPAEFKLIRQQLLLQ